MSGPFDNSTPHLGAGAWGNAPSDVQTTFMPHGGTVPAVPAASQQQGAYAGSFAGSFQPGPQQGGSVPAVPQAQGQGQGKLPFMSSTALPTASGTIGQPGPGRGPQGPPGAPSQPSASAQQAPAGGPAERDTQPLLNNNAAQQAPSKYPFYNIRRYRPYFDVDTKEVLWRVGNSMIGAFRANFMLTTQEKPDLYGPFWVATTLIFVTAVAGNYAHYIAWRREQNKADPSPPPPVAAFAPPGTPGAAPTPSSSTPVEENQWFTDYTKLAASAGIFYGYVFGLSLLLWLVLRYLRSDMKLVNMFCIYGYAMTIFIPVSLICIIPVELLRWCLVMGCTLTSGLFLLMNLKERTMPAGAGKAVPMLLLVLLLHLGLGLALKLYYFQY